MKFIQPSVEYWPQTNVIEHIAKVGRICYKTQGAQPDETLTDAERAQFLMERDKKRCKGFWDSGHKSMYRHGSVYFFVPNQDRLPGFVWGYFDACPYMEYTTKGRSVWISTNMQFLSEQPKVRTALDKYWVEEQDFIKIALDKHYPEALILLRMTFVVTTQISTSRELNRTSPNAIAEQSTRYVNLKNKGGVQICTPHWYQGLNEDGAPAPSPSASPSGSAAFQAAPSLPPFKHFLARLAFRAGCKFSEWMYRALLALGLKPQDARGILPIDTYTIVAYTYSIQEWNHIIDLRYHGTTGKPHPNARIAASQIRDQINTHLAALGTTITL